MLLGSIGKYFIAPEKAGTAGIFKTKPAESATAATRLGTKNRRHPSSLLAPVLVIPG